MRNRKPLICIVLSIAFLANCRDPYEISLDIKNANYLVVEGFLDYDRATTIKLSRLNAFEETMFKPEENAIIEVEGEDNSVQLVPYTEEGKYVSELSLAKDKKYRVRIRTRDEKEYLSEYLDFVQSPEIENISWERIDDRVHFFVDTKDPENKTWYYRWEYEETWSFTTPMVSNWDYVNGEFIPRTSDNLFPHRCYATSTSNRILLKSNDLMSEDVVVKHPFLTVSNSNNRLVERYSVNLKQYGLTKGAFLFWYNLQKSTEGMGSIFDPQPTQLSSNIICISDPDELAVGFLSAGSYTEKRLFIDVFDELPLFRARSGYETCFADTVVENDYSLFASGVLVVIQYDPGSNPPGCPPEERCPTKGVPAYCVDCRERGTDIKPDFWD